MGALEGNGDERLSVSQLSILYDWLAQLNSYAQRKFFEEHCEELLRVEIEHVLIGVLAEAELGDEAASRVKERLAILREVRLRGGDVEAIRETYANARGGFTLDLPEWLDEVIGEYVELSILPADKTAGARIALFTAALTRAETDAVRPEAVAELHNKRAIAYKEDRRRDRAQALEAAIEDHSAALQVYTHSRYPRQWALTHNNLGHAYSARVVGERADNLERAIDHFRAARRVFTRVDYPIYYATTMSNLGGAFQERIQGNRRNNIERAIRCLKVALAVRVTLDEPMRQAHTLYNLGGAYQVRIAGSPYANVERAIECFQESLDLLNRVDPSHEYSLVDYVNAQDHLALAYLERLAGRPRDNLENAVERLTVTASLLTPELYPSEWGTTEHNLGLAYHYRVAGSRRDNLEIARDHFLASLRVRTPDAAPRDYATTQNSLGTLYRERMSGEPRENIRTAIECFEAALKIRTPLETPLDYAATQNNLGGVYWTSSFGNRSENLERAIMCFEEALSVYERADLAEDRAMTQMNLGSAYWIRIAGEREENLERARLYLEAALRTYTKLDYPERHANTLSNLGVVYLRRTSGNRAENLARARDCFVVARDFYSSDPTSLLYRNAHLNLASLAFEGLVPTAVASGDDAALQAAYFEAHEHYGIARACQRDLGWLESDAQGRARLQGAHHATRELYARDAWCLLQLGDLEGAACALEEGRAQALFESQAIAGALLEKVCPDHRVAYESARQHLQESQASVHAPTDLRSARDEFLALCESIRAHCASDFLHTATSYTEITSATADDQAMVYLAAVEYGGFALFIPPCLESQATAVAPRVIPLPHLTWRVVDDWLRTPDERGRVRSGYQLALQRKGWETLLRVIFDESDPEAIQALLKLPLRDLPDQLPRSMGTLSRALSSAIRDVIVETDGSQAAPRARVDGAASTPSNIHHREDATVSHGLEDNALRVDLARQLAWRHQVEELNVVLPALQRVIVEPLCEALANEGYGPSVQRLALIPCGRLGVFPLHAALVKQDGLPFGETYNVTYQASARTLKNARESRLKLPLQGAVFAVGNPLTSTGSAPLPFAGHEAEAIVGLARRAGLRTSRVLVGASATRSRVLAELKRTRESAAGAWFHFAGHGRTSVYDPSQSYLLLSGLDAEGHFERLSLDMLQRDRLLVGITGVTASGCVTGLGDIELAPDELNSFAAGVLQSGAGCVVATLWSVKDYATCLLMTRFHQIRLSSATVSPAEALRAATQWLRTSTGVDIDLFAREMGMPTMAEWDVVRDSQRGDALSESELSDQSLGMAGNTFVHASASINESNAAASVSGGPRTSNNSDVEWSDMPFSHPVYWAAAIAVGDA